MSNVKLSNGHGSDVTSRIGSPPSTARSLLTERPRTERELLERRGELARLGMAACLDDMKSDGRELLDLDAWAYEKPWVTLGVGAGTGFLAGRMMFSAPSEKERAPKGGTLIASLLTPLISLAIVPLLRGFARKDEDDFASSPLQRIAFGPILTGLIKRMV